MKYQVLRQHFGDKQYMAGDEREVKNKSDADQLIKMGLIAETKEEKAAPKAQNKMAKKTANKAE
ncbi:hypothetical protein [Psychrobacter namhaensis]|uniref:hypothetical protein n=1 Tax=Psychrobacter namhaensis TaxID=292734 RepID=UPI0018E04ECA|nr:hypothetical protein [Psychrobacter namhaensis]